MCVYTTVMGIAYSMGEVVHINVSMTIYIYIYTYIQYFEKDSRVSENRTARWQIIVE